MLDLEPRLPQPLREKLELLLVQIPTDPVKAAPPLGQRLMNVLGVLAQADVQHWLDAPFYWYSPITGSYTLTGFDPWQTSNFLAWRGYWIWVNQSNLRMLVP